MKDVRNIEIQQGDTVAYATRRGSMMDLRVGEVVSAEEGSVKVQPEKTPVDFLLQKNPRSVILKTPAYVVSLGKLVEEVEEAGDIAA